MNVIDIIRDCILLPRFAKDYDVEELTVNQTLDTCTITNESAFSGISSIKKCNTIAKNGIEQQMLRMYMRVWTGITKSLCKVLSEGNCFVSLSLGYFFPLKGILGKFAYSPTYEILDRYDLSLDEDLCNVHPSNRFVCCIMKLDTCQ